MDHRHFMGAQTHRLLEQTRQQTVAGMIPMINQPTLEIAQLATPQFSAMDQLNKQASELLGTATKATAQLQAMMGTSMTAQGTLQGLFPRPDLPASLRASLDAGSNKPTIAGYLARTNATSIFAFQGPTIAEQLGAQIDTKALMGLTGMADTEGTIAEQWRLANTGALSNFGESFNSLSAALDFEQALKSSGLAQSVLREAFKLDDDHAHILAEADLIEPADTRVEAELEADHNLAKVVGVVQQYFVVYLGYSASQAHNLVRRIIWVIMFTVALYTHSQVGDQLNGTVELGLGMVALSAIGMAATKTAEALIPDGKFDPSE